MMRSTRVYDSAARLAPLVEELQALFRYRDLIFQLVARSVKVRYKRSILGVAWTMMNPLLTMGVLTLVFSKLFNFNSSDYALYVLSGLLIWNLFAQSTTAAMGDLIWSGGLLGRVFVPKTVFAISALGTGLVNFILALGAYVLIAWIIGTKIPLTVFLLPIPIFLVSLFTLGVGLVLSTAAIYFPDTVPMYEVFLTAWLYLTPVIYPVELLPQGLQRILQFNPLYPLLTTFRAVLVEGQLPDGSSLLISSITALGMLSLGWWIFTRRAREYAYRL
ncbi:MAG: ABC transporter permease [Anaerolineales bacterium]|nr:ABC transporter permease [Anaerolineales bacterium]